MSMGLAITESGTSPEELVGEADAAMYEAKARGRNRIEVFDPSMRARLTERIEITNGFRGALERGEFHLCYQPMFALDTLRVVGFEALARWDHPALGPVPPSTFVPVAEETGFIVPLGRWALLEATRQLAEWSGITERPLRMAVNLSRRQLTAPELADDVRLAIRTSGIAPSQLVARDHRERAHGRPRAGHGGPGRAAVDGHRHRRRRLRHGVLVAQLPPAVPRGRAQDRPGLHRAPEPVRTGQHRPGQHHHRPGPHHGARRRGRGYRAARPARPPGGTGLLHRSGIPDVPSARRRPPPPDSSRPATTDWCRSPTSGGSRSPRRRGWRATAAREQLRCAP